MLAAVIVLHGRSDMATTKKDNLMELLKANPPAKQFVPYCHWSKEADALTVYFEGDSKRLTDHVTIYLSEDTDEIIGCRIKGIAGIIEDLPNYVQVQHNEYCLSVVFLPFLGGATVDVRRAINTLARQATAKKMVLEPCLG
jgi:hypothetical protein